ncbi:MAG: uroporphyrinogen decarboxylase family protein [Anaerolineae bacterium]|nr:uroporphyrinogen decarboxylase family protein [Anaerolineae bacterium]
MSLTPRERVLAEIQHREPDAVPYTLYWEGDVGERLDAHFAGPAWRSRLDNAIRGVPGPNLVVDETAGPCYTDLFGSTWQLDHRPYRLIRPALSEPSLEGYRFPSLEACFPPGWKERALHAIEAYRDHFLVVGFGFGLFERTWTLRGFDEVLMDAAADPGFYDRLVGAVAEHQMAIVERLLELPVDGIMFSDDWGYQRGVLLGPERWRRFIKPRLARMYERVHGAGRYVLSHCCGSIADIMPDVIEIGLDVLESVQPEAEGMDPYGLKRRYGGQITLWGGLGSQSIIPFGTPAAIRAEVAKLCREIGRSGGYILSPAKALQPETPTENAAAVVEAFLEASGTPLG